MRFRNAAVAIVILSALVAVAAVTTNAQGVPDDQREKLLQQIEALKKRMAVGPQPDSDSANWKPISEDMGIWLYKDQFGSLRGRLYVKDDESWLPIALEGLDELGPKVLPAG